jgi:hypothetical protein
MLTRILKSSATGVAGSLLAIIILQLLYLGWRLIEIQSGKATGLAIATSGFRWHEILPPAVVGFVIAFLWMWQRR